MGRRSALALWHKISSALLPPVVAVAHVVMISQLVTPVSMVEAQVQTLTASHTYVMGDNDSKNDARQRCFLEAKRKVIEQVGVYIESSSEMKGFELTNDQITSYAAAVFRIEILKEEYAVRNGQATLSLTVKADVDVADMKNRLATQHQSGQPNVWVLWEEKAFLMNAGTETQASRQTDILGSAFASLKDCEKTLQRFTQEDLAHGNKMTSSQVLEWRSRDGKMTITTSYRCLPDTMNLHTLSSQ